MWLSAFSSALLEDLQSSVLQASQDDRVVGMTRWVQMKLKKLECLPFQTALHLGDGLNTKRRLGGFSLLKHYQANQDNEPARVRLWVQVS